MFLKRNSSSSLSFSSVLGECAPLEPLCDKIGISPKKVFRTKRDSWKPLLSFVALLLLVSITAIHAQCPDQIRATSQASLVSLMEDYPDCEFLAGKIQVGGDVSDLSPLTNIKTIGGDFWIINNNVLTDLQGVGNLTSIGGSLRITNAEVLVSCQGLSSLGSIAEDLIVTGSDALMNFKGLNALTQIGRDLNVQTSQGFQSLDGLQSLKSVQGKIWLLRLEALSSVDELQSLTTVGGDIQIKSAGNMKSINGLSTLKTIGGGLSIIENAKLESISGFSGLTSANFIGIGSNDLLTSIIGFENLVMVESGLGIDTESNSTVSEFTSLETIGFRLDIEGVASAGFPSLKSVEGDFVITSENMTELTGCNMLESVGGDMILKTGLSDLPDFQNLETIGKRIIIDSRETLEILDGFNALTSVGIGALGWGFDVYEHDKLVSITGFNNLQNIKGSFVISYCDTLVSVEGFKSLSKIDSNFVVRNNPKLSDCSPFCEFITSGTLGGNYLIAANGPFETSACWAFETVEDNCTFSFTLIDANPMYYQGWLGNSDSIQDLEKEDLLDLPETRKAIAADGATEVLLITTFKNEGSISATYDDKKLKLPWGPETYEKDGIHYAFAILKAPDEFPGNNLSPQNQDGISIENIEVNIEFEDMKISTRTAKIPVVRPPVVLMHGTYSNPDSAWKSSLGSGGVTMEDFLTFKGFKVFTVDYTSSNGLANPSSFEHNKMALWGEDKGGIKDALEAYRSLEIATTRVDVVGHSMGGVLPRVYASEAYDDDSSSGKKYKRPDNFEKGDIIRLITIASTHFGSHLGEFQLFMNNLSLIQDGPWQYLFGQLSALVGDWLTGTPATEAVCDQVPGSEALEKIGRTDIPSHAITCQVNFGKMALVDDVDAFNTLFTVLSWATYAAGPYQTYLNKKLEKCANDKIKAGTTVDGINWQNVFKGMTDEEIFVTMMEQGSDSNSPMYAALDESFEMAPNIERFNPILSDFAMSDGEESWGEVFSANSEPLVLPDYFNAVPAKSADEIKAGLQAKFDLFTDMFRYMIFDNDHNDGTVRVESQAGEMPEDFVTHLQDVWHSSAPKYGNVQLRVLELLDSGLEHFNPDGFPAFPEPNVSDPDPGSYGYFQKLYHPLWRLGLGQPKFTREQAICQSGMVASHAKMFARVADRNNVVVIARPVNPDATALIARSAATKIMDIKPKSSNWGPHKGYLPRLQRYSKIWRVFKGTERDDKIEEYTNKATQNITDEIADSIALKVELCTEEFWVYINSAMNEGPLDKNAEDEVVLVPVFNLQEVCDWSENSSTGEVVPINCRPQEPEDDLVPFQVMASPMELDENGQPRVLTADYDLLMIGFYKGEDNPYNPPSIPFREGVGQMTSQQETLMDDLNEAVFITGYDGGNVTHHGPENQFSKSPYIDYPLTVFAPDGNPSPSSGDIISIQMGPPGFRDIYLKQFVNDMREKGYDLYDNPEAPGWKWHWDEAIEAFDLSDSPNIGDYVDALPFRKCDKAGFPSVNSSCRQIILAAAEHSHAVKNQENSPFMTPDIAVYPNPVEYGFVNIDITAHNIDIVEYTVTDPLGNVVAQRSIYPYDGHAEDDLDINHLKPGLYTITLNSAGVYARFVKI